MAEVNILKFVTDNIFLVGVAFVSGAMLVWPVVRRGVAGATISTLQATLLINQQNALVLDVREAAEYEKGHMLNARNIRSEEHTSELQSPDHLVCRLLLEKKKYNINPSTFILQSAFLTTLYRQFTLNKLRHSWQPFYIHLPLIQATTNASQLRSHVLWKHT